MLLTSSTRRAPFSPLSNSRRFPSSSVPLNHPDRLPAPTRSRLHRSGSTAVASVENAASATTVAHRFLSPQRDGRPSRDAGSGSVGGFARSRRSIGRIGARGALVARLASDVLAAMASSLMVSPFISIVDRSIIQGASGTMGMKASLAQGLRVMVTKPALFSSRPDFICTFFLYAATCEACLRSLLGLSCGSSATAPFRREPHHGSYLRELCLRVTMRRVLCLRLGGELCLVNFRTVRGATIRRGPYTCLFHFDIVCVFVCVCVCLCSEFFQRPVAKV